MTETTETQSHADDCSAATAALIDESQTQNSACPRVSIIIPTLNEAERIAELVEQTRGIGDCEVIVVDGESDDETAEKALAADQVQTSARGRAIQQNAGAEAASGDVFLFLHADCRLNTGALDAVVDALRDPSVVGGCFRQHIDAPGVRYRLLEWGNALRVKLWKWAYGDQGIFVRREIFEQLGGFPDQALMEDLFLMKRLKKQGRIVQLDVPLRVLRPALAEKGSCPADAAQLGVDVSGPVRRVPEPSRAVLPARTLSPGRGTAANDTCSADGVSRRAL